MLRMFEGKQFQVRGPKLRTECTILCYHDGVTKYRIAEWIYQQPRIDGSPYTSQWDATSASKLPIPTGRCKPPSNTCFPGPTQVHNLNSILIGSCRAHDRDRPTDRPRYSTCNNKPYKKSQKVKMQ